MMASVQHYWLKRGRMSAVPSMAVAPEPPLDTGSFVASCCRRQLECMTLSFRPLTDCIADIRAMPATDDGRPTLRRSD
jgi:hypothetical protein